MNGTVIGDIGLGVTEMPSLKDRMLALHRTLPPNDVPNSLRVFIVREPFDEYYTLVLDNGYTEEFEDLETRAWLGARGADEELVNKVMTQAWNFYRALCIIKNPKPVVESQSPLAPRITSM